MKTIFLALALLAACSDKATISKDAVGIRVSNITTDIEHLNEIRWWIGLKKKEERVTQSITFLISTPHLSKSDLNHLIEERGIDSWLIRVIHLRGSKSRDLGSMLIPFKPKSKGRGSSTAVTSHAAVKIYYAAAFASERFRTFKCPAFNHDKRITSMSVEGEDEAYELIIGGGTSYEEKAQLVQLTPSSFNGGHTLLGEFHFELAPYDAHKKMLLGPFKRMPRYVEIKREDTVYVESCKGVHPELD